MSSTQDFLRGPNVSNSGIRIFQWCVAAGLGLVMLYAFHISQFSTGFETLPGDELDARFITYCLEHLYSWMRGGTSFASPEMFFPVKGTIGYSDALVLLSLPYAAFRLSEMTPLLAMSWAIVAVNGAAYVSALVLFVRGFRLAILPAAFAAALIAFNSAKMNQLNHLQLQPIFPLALMLLVLVTIYRHRDTLGNGRLVWLLFLFSVLFHLEILTSYYLCWYFASWLVLLALIGLSRSTWRQGVWHFLKSRRVALLLSGVLFALLAIPFLVIYLPVVRAVGWRSFGEVVGMIPTWKSFFWMSEQNFVWGWIPKFIDVYSLPLHWEHRIGVGAVTTFASLGVFAWSVGYLWRTRKTPGQHGTSPSPLAITAAQTGLPLAFYAVLASSVALYVLLAFRVGPDTLWRVMFHLFPGAKGVRAVSRYILVVLLPLCAVLGLLLQHAFNRAAAKSNTTLRTALQTGVVLLAGFALFEQLGRPLGFSRRWHEARLEDLRARLPADCAAFYITAPATSSRWNEGYLTDALLVSALSGIPTLNGYSGQTPPGWALSGVRDGASYVAEVEKWTRKHDVKGRICELASLD